MLFIQPKYVVLLSSGDSQYHICLALHTIMTGQWSLCTGYRAFVSLGQQA